MLTGGGRTLLFVLIFSLLSSWYTYADGQAKSITVQFNNLTLSEAIRQIEKASGYSFFYDENQIDLSRRVSLKATNQSIGEALNILLKSTGLTYEISNNQIALMPIKKNEEQASPKSEQPSIMQSNKKTITGIVKDEAGIPIIGANVVEKGTTNGIITNVDGQFTLTVSDNSSLRISYIGYITQEVQVKGTSLNIVLKEDAQKLSEVVVTGFGLAQKKESLTSAIAVIGSDDIARTSATTSSGALVGKVAGINFRQTDGRPGKSASLQIRNMGTPLYVIDGVQKDEGQFNNIDYNDIESISILKDASASIYGVRAANGVVVVTTKKGRLNTKNTVTLNAHYGWQSITKFPKPADALTYVSSYIQSETIQGVTNRKYTDEDYKKWQQGTEKNYRPFDWYDFIWETSPQYYVGANVSGGSDKINYYFAVSHTDQDAMIHEYGGFERTNVQMNIDAQINKRFKIGGSMNGRIEKKINPGVPGGDDYWTAIFATYRNLPTVRPYANDNPKYPAKTSQNPEVSFGMLNYDLSGKFEDTWRVMQLNFNAEYEILDGLKAKALVGYYLANQNLDNQEYTYKLYRYDEKNDEYLVDYEMNNPWRERNTKMIEEYSSNIQLSYAKKFGEHSVAGILGMEAIKRDQPRHWVHSVPTTNSLHLISLDEIVEFTDEGKRTEARLGYMMRFNYDFASKYLVEFSGRYDGSWKFPPNHRWGFFPSGSVGWRMSEENFWKESKLGNVVNDFKLRASYGMVGDDNVADYSAFDYMKGYNYKNGGATIDGDYVVGAVPRGLPVTTLSWMKSKILDIGVDVSFFNSRLTGTVDYFDRLRNGISDSRYDVLIPSEAGFGLPKENLRSDRHRGYDLMIRWSDQVQDFYYSIAGNFTYSRFYDWHQYKPRFGNSWHQYRNSIYERYGYLNWMLEADGQFQSWEEISNWPIDNDRQGNKTLRPGDIKYVDQNGDGVINYLDERPLGYRQGSTPILNFGFNFNFQYKGFDLAFDLSGGALNSYDVSSEQKNPFHDGGNNPQYYMGDQWRLSDIFDPNSELIPGKYPTLLLGNGGHSNYWKSTFWVRNTRYLKLTNLEFGYTLPKYILEKAFISDLRFYVSGQNLFTISNTPTDPEVDKDTGLQYPTTRVFNVGLTLKF